jgi:hypothetical protein
MGHNPNPTFEELTKDTGCVSVEYREDFNEKAITNEASTGYVPRKLQQLFHNTLKRFNVLVCHRRFGKTVFSVNELIDRALRNKLRNPQYAYVAPTYKQAKQIAWQYFVDYTRNIPGAKPNKSELCIYIKRDWRVCPLTGKPDPDVIKLMLIGADDPDSLRGIYLDGAVLDEFAQCDPILWGEIIRPALADRKREARAVGLIGTHGYKEPWAIFIGTPKGQNHFYRRYKKAMESEKLSEDYEIEFDVKIEEEEWDEWEKKYGIVEGVSKKDVDRKLADMPERLVTNYRRWRKYKANRSWFTALYRASETGILDSDEIDEMIEDLDDEEVQQELECSFTAAIKGSYYGHTLNQIRDRGQISKVPYNPSFPVDTFWDIGVGDKTVIWFRQKIGGRYYYIDYFEMNGEGLEFYVKLLHLKEGYVGRMTEIKAGIWVGGEGYSYGRHVWPHDGKAREFTTGQTRQERAWKKFGLRVQIQGRTGIQDRIDARRARLKVSFFDEEKCFRGLECLYNYQKEWDSKKGLFNEKPNHDWSSHGADGFGYSSMDDKDSVVEMMGKSGRLGQSTMGTANGDYNELGE